MGVTLDLARDLLDRQIVDSEDCPCGKVDDIELEQEDETFQLTFLLSGPGAAAHRLPPLAARLYRWIAGTGRVRVPWADVDHETRRESQRLMARNVRVTSWRRRDL